MAPLSYLASAVLTGVFLVVVVGALARSREWRDYAPMQWAGGGGGGSVAGSLLDLARTPLAWTVTFLVLTVIVGAATVALVTGSVPAGVARMAGMALAAVAVVVLGAYLAWGVHRTTRSRGFASAQAAAVGVWALGLAVLGAVVVQLVLA